MRAEQIRLPKGYSFKFDRELPCNCGSCGKYMTYVVRLMDGLTEAGKIRLRGGKRNAKGAKMYETHSYLGEQYRGKKLGALMYAKAVQWGLRRGYRVSSSTSPSDLAERVWNSRTIRKYVRIIRRPSDFGSMQYHCYRKAVRT